MSLNKRLDTSLDALDIPDGGRWMVREEPVTCALRYPRIHVGAQI